MIKKFFSTPKQLFNERRTRKDQSFLTPDEFKIKKQEFLQNNPILKGFHFQDLKSQNERMIEHIQEYRENYYDCKTGGTQILYEPTILMPEVLDTHKFIIASGFG
jgi:hypothetical protein